MSDVTTTAPNASTAPVIHAPLPSLTPFDPTKPKEFGNQYLESLIVQTAFDEELQNAQQAGDEVKKFIGFELAKAVMHAVEADPELNLHAIFEGNAAVLKLNNRMLRHFGVIERKIVDDDAVTVWTSKKSQEAYDYAAVDKDKDEAEYTRRNNNRKRLNMRLSEACKMAIALMDHGVKGDQLKLSQNTAGQTEAVIENAPAAIRGDEKKNGSTVVFGKRTANEGATVAPNVAALVKAATTAHKKEDPEATGIAGERADKGGDRNEHKLGMSDEDFGLIVNNLRRAIMAQENKLTAEQIKQLKALVPFIGEQVKASEAAAKQAEKEKAE